MPLWTSKSPLLWLVLLRHKVIIGWWEGLCTKKFVVCENKLASEIKVLLRQGKISHVVLCVCWEVVFLCVLLWFFF